MKINQLLTAFMAGTVMLFSSCAKDEGPDDNPPGTGTIKVSVNWVPTPNTSTRVYTFVDMTVTLKKDGSELGTQYTAGGTVDMGAYEYGTYTVKVKGRERSTIISNGSSVINTHCSLTQTVVLDNPTKTASFTCD